MVVACPFCRGQHAHGLPAVAGVTAWRVAGCFRGEYRITEEAVA